MKITQKKILQMTRSVLRGEKYYGEHLLLHPTREWSLGMLCFVVLCLGGSWWAATVYVRYVDVSTLFGEGTITEGTKYRSAQVTQALEVLDSRAVQYQQILGRYTTMPAPSESDDLGDKSAATATTTENVSAPSVTTTADVPALDDEMEIVEPVVEEVIPVPEEGVEPGVSTLVF
ncbi:hypothetical protein K2Q16_01210 [Patescibacteria group bacterium]|nr:hypothetical protein [Patescibacteria group bacterium]